MVTISSVAPLRQVAALPFLPTDGGIEVLLVTSRGAGNWQLPKGWPVPDHTLAEAAAREAYEEAGVAGAVVDGPLGSYGYRKKTRAGERVPCRVLVFPLLVDHHLLGWPERGQRQLAWLPLAAAAERVGPPGLARLLAKLARDRRGLLRAATTAAPAAAGYGASGLPSLSAGAPA